MNVGIIANGQLNNDNVIFEKLKLFDLIIAADGGANHCIRLKVTPDLIIGDFDSITSQTLDAFANVPKMQFKKDKDETDLELSIKHAFSLGADTVTLFAATGNRMDHTLVNLAFLSRYPAKLFIETEDQTIFSLDETVAFNSFKIKTFLKQTISFLPLINKVEGVTSKGLKWELNDAELDENFLSISNVCLSSETLISIKKGNLLCFLLH